jgi:hypothetical protein
MHTMITFDVYTQVRRTVPEIQHCWKLAEERSAYV